MLFLIKNLQKLNMSVRTNLKLLVIFFSWKLTNYNIKACMARYAVGHLLLQAFSFPPGCICLVSLTLCLWLYMGKFRQAFPLQGISGVEDNLYKINKWCCFFIIAYPWQLALFTLEEVTELCRKYLQQIY